MNDRAGARIALLGALLVVLGAAWSAPNTIDDAFISLRYAEHLAQGQGLVFNPGERVEGYSNPLWVLLLAASAALGLPTLATAKLLGALAAAGAVASVAAAARRGLGLGLPATAFATLWLAGSAGMAFYAASGMETSLYVAAHAALLALALVGHPVAAGLAAAVAATCRPEGLLALVPLAAGLLARPAPARRAALTLAVPVLAALAWTAFRLDYYGTLLPNTFQAKVGAERPIWQVWADNLGATGAYLAFFARQQLALGLPLLLLPGLLLGRSLRPLLPVLASLGVALLFCLTAGDDWMAFGRFALPAFPAIALLVAAGADATLSRLPVAGRALLVAGLAAVVAHGLHGAATGIGALRDGRGGNPANHSRDHLAIGVTLADRGRPGDAVVVNEIGAIGYVSGLRVVDLLGLVDPLIARIGASDALSYPEYVLRDAPRFVLLNDRASADDPAPPAMQQPIWDRLLDGGLHDPVARFPLGDWKGLVLYERRAMAPPAPGQGLRGRYHATPDWTGPAVERVDPQVVFHWTGARPVPEVPADGFSVRWEGRLVLDRPIILVAGADEPLRVWLDGALVLANEAQRAWTVATGPRVEPGDYAVRVDYADTGGWARVLLGWTDGERRPEAIPWAWLRVPDEGSD